MGPPRVGAILATAASESRPPIVGGALFTDPPGDSRLAPDIREITPFSDQDGRAW